MIAYVCVQRYPGLAIHLAHAPRRGRLAARTICGLAPREHGHWQLTIPARDGLCRNCRRVRASRRRRNPGVTADD